MQLLEASNCESNQQYLPLKVNNGFVFGLWDFFLFLQSVYFWSEDWRGGGRIGATWG